MKKTWWIKNTRGKPDAMLTFALFSFLIVTFNIFLATFGMVSFGDYSVTFESMDSSVMAVYLGATFTAYVSRRFTDTRFAGRSVPEVIQEMPVPSVGSTTVTTTTVTPAPSQGVLDSSDSTIMGGR